MRAITSIGGSRIAVILAIGVVAACSSGSSATGGPSASTGAASPPASAATSPAAPESVSPEPTIASTAPEPSLATAVATAVDPCQLVTKEEASKLAGTDLGAGKELTVEKTKECVFGTATNQVHVAVIQAPDEATAQAAKTSFEDQIKKQGPPGLKFTDLPDLADGGAVAEFSTTISGQTISGSAIYVLKGVIAFGITDIVFGKGAASSADLQALAQTVLGRLP